MEDAGQRTDEFVGATVVNEATKRYHTLFFRKAEGEGYKSFLIGTEGFKELDDAVREKEETCERHGWKVSPNLFDWDGNGVPEFTSDFQPLETSEDLWRRRYGVNYTPW
jgi:hypothetical protein